MYFSLMVAVKLCMGVSLRVAVKFFVGVFQPDGSCQVVSVGVSMMVAVKL